MKHVVFVFFAATTRGHLCLQSCEKFYHGFCKSAARAFEDRGGQWPRG